MIIKFMKVHRNTKLKQEHPKPHYPFCFVFHIFHVQPQPRNQVYKSPSIQQMQNAETKLLATTSPGVSLPPLREHASLSSLLIPARATGSHIRVCRFTLLCIQVREETTRRAG